MAVNWDDFKIADQQPQRAPVNWDDFKIADQQAAEPSGLVRRALGDTAVSLAKGVIGAGETAVGLANLPTAGGAGKLLEGIGYDPKAAKETLDTLYSPEQQRANQAVQQASGFMGKAGAMLQNPSTIAQSVAESVPLMLGGGALAQGLGKAGMLAGSPVMRGAIGEGLTGAGLAAEGTRQETEDGMLTPGQVGTSLASGAGTALIGAAGGKIAQKLGIGDVDTMLAQGAIGQSAKGRARRFVEGAISEGVLEEMPQSAQEQVWQNVALGRPWDENVPESAATGLIAGLAMGGGAGALPSTARPAASAQPTQPPQPAIDPNAGPLSKVASMATQTPELNPLAFTPMEPTGPALETDAQTQERLRAAQFQADALPFEPSLSFDQEPQPVRATTQDGMPFERIGPQDYDTLNPIRAGEGELLDAERPTAGRTRAPDAIEGQAQQRIGVADDGQQGNQAPMRTLGERVKPAQGDNAPTRALPYFTDQKAEQSARKALPFANEPAAQKKADELSKKRNEPFTVIPHPALADRFAVVPSRKLADRPTLQGGSQDGPSADQASTDTTQGGKRTSQASWLESRPSLTSSSLNPNYRSAANVAQGQAAARAQAGQQGTMPRVEQGAQQSASDGLAATAPTTSVQTQPSTEIVTNGLPPVEQTTQEAEAARGQEGAKAGRQAAPAVADTADNEVVRALRHSKEFIARFKDNPSELKKQQRFTAAAEKKFGISKIAGYRGGLTVHVADRNDGNATVYMQGPSGNFLEAGTIPLSQTAVYGGAEQSAPNQRSESAQPDISPDTITPNPAPAKAKVADTQKPLTKILAEQNDEIDAANARHAEVMAQLGREMGALESKINPVRNKGQKRDELNDRARESRLANEAEVRAILDRYRPIIDAHPEEIERRAESRRKTQELKAQIAAERTPQPQGERNGLQEEGRREEVAPENVAQEAIHKDPGKPAEPVTAPVIAQAIQKSARNTEFNPVEARNWLMGEIDKAIENVPPAAADIEADMRREKAKKFVLSDRVKRLSPSKTRDTLEKQERDEFEFRQRDAIAKLAGQIGFVTFDVPGDGKFKVVNTVEKLNDFKAKVKSSPGFAKNPDRPMTYGSGLAGGQNLDQQVADAKKFGGDPLADIGNAIEIARLKNSKDEDALLDRFKEASGGKDYDAWRAEQEAADEIEAREEAQAEQSPSDRFRAEVERRKQEREGPKQAKVKDDDRQAGISSRKEEGRQAFIRGEGRTAWQGESWAKERTATLLAGDWLKGYDEAKADADAIEARKGLQVVVLPSEYPTQDVDSSYAHISHSGAARAKDDRDSFVSHINALFDAAMQKAETPEQREAANKAIQEYKSEYLRRLQPVIRVRSQTYSGFVAGRAKINTRQADSRNSALDRAIEAFSSWVKSASSAIMDAVLAARNSDQLAAERQAKESKESKKREQQEALISKILNFRPGDDVKFGSYKIARVTNGRDGYPSSVTVDATDLTDNKFDLARTLFGGDKEKLRAIVDAVRSKSQQAQEQPKQAVRVEQPSAPAAQEAQPEQPESFPVNPELESLFESLDGTSTRKANKAKKSIQSDPRADKINMVQDKFLDILQALEDSGAVKINCK